MERRNFSLLAASLAAALIACPVDADPGRSSRYCGDEALSCEESERCCEHVVAMFSTTGVNSPPYVQGRCIPKEQRCADFWCGNRHCESGFFGTPTVCCINDRPGLSTEYRCAYSELSCPGNRDQLTIRERLPSRPLQRS
jgi:hypothetical protein